MAAASSSSPVIPAPNDIYAFWRLGRALEVLKNGMVAPFLLRAIAYDVFTHEGPLTPPEWIARLEPLHSAYAAKYPDDVAILAEVTRFEADPAAYVVGSVPVWKLERFYGHDLGQFPHKRLTDSLETFRSAFLSMKEKTSPFRRSHLPYTKADEAVAYVESLGIDVSVSTPYYVDILVDIGVVANRELMEALMEQAEYPDWIRFRFVCGAAYAGHLSLCRELGSEDLNDILEYAAYGGQLHILKEFLPKFLADTSLIKDDPDNVAGILIKESVRGRNNKVSEWLLSQLKPLFPKGTMRANVFEAGMQGMAESDSVAKAARYLRMVPAEYQNMRDVMELCSNGYNLDVFVFLLSKVDKVGEILDIEILLNCISNVAFVRAFLDRFNEERLTLDISASPFHLEFIQEHAPPEVIELLKDSGFL